MGGRRRRGQHALAPIEQRSLVYEGWNETTGEWSSDATVGRFVIAVKAGSTIDAAAGWAKITARTMHRWLARGHEIASGLPSDEDWNREMVAPEERVFFDLVVATEWAEDVNEVELVTLWRSGARDNWQAAMHLLSRRHRKDWGEKTSVELSGPGGGPIVTAAVDLELAKKIAANPEARAMASQLLAMVAPVAPPVGD